MKKIIKLVLLLVVFSCVNIVYAETDANTVMDSGVIENTAVETEQRKFVEADIDFIIRSYAPSISGTICCTEGKKIVLTIINLRDDTVMLNKTITAEDGVVTLSKTLPNLLVGNKYEVTMVYSENDKELLRLIGTVDTATLYTELSGMLMTADNVSISAHLRSVNTNSFDTNKTVTGEKAFSMVIPNLIPNASFNLYSEAYETVVVEQEPAENYSTYTFNGATNDEILLVATGNNITTFENKSYEIIYDEEKLMPIELYKSYFENALNGNKNGGVEIISKENGNIKFRMVNMEIPEDECWNGVMHIFKFKNILEEAITTDIQFREIQ